MLLITKHPASCMDNIHEACEFLEPCYSKYGARTIRIGIPWELVINADSQTYWIRIFECDS